MGKTVTLRLDEETYRVLSEAARVERRSLSNMIQSAAVAAIRDRQFVDEYEMAEILASESLMKRLKKGSRDARARRGRLIG